MREVIAGIYMETLIKDVVVLLLFFIGALVMGVLLKKKANAALHEYAEQLGHSGVVEH